MKIFSLFIIAFLALAAAMSSTINMYDEGLMLLEGERSSRGEVPYRDFWTLYGPAQAWILGLLFEMFGTSVLVERLWDTSIRAAYSVLAFLVVLNFSTIRLAFLAWLLSVAVLACDTFYAYPLIPAGLFSLACMYFLLLFLAGRKGIGWVALSGLSLGIATLFRHDIGIMTALSAVVSIFIFNRAAKPRVASSISNFQIIISLVLATIVVVGPVYVHLLFVVPYSDLLNAFVDFPLRIYPIVRSSPFPAVFETAVSVFENANTVSLNHFILTLANSVSVFFAPVVAIIGLVSASPRRGEQEELVTRTIVVRLLSLFIIILFAKSLVRPSFTHVIHIMIPAIALACILVNSNAHYFRSIGTRLLRWLVLLNLLAVLIIRTFAFPIDVPYPFAFFSQSEKKILSSYTIARADGFAVGDDKSAAIVYIKQHTSSGEKIFVGLDRHDKIFVNDVAFYFLAERPSATKYHHLCPGLVTSQEIQQEIIEELKNSAVRYVVLFDGWRNLVDSMADLSVKGSLLLDDYIRRCYREEVSFGKYRILRRNDTIPICSP